MNYYIGCDADKKYSVFTSIRHKPYLTHAGKAKKMAGQLNKTDKLDAYSLARLLKSGTLPVVWIPPGSLIASMPP